MPGTSRALFLEESMDTLNKYKQLLDKLVRILAMTLFVGVIVLTIAQVLSRYLMKFPIAFSEELARILFIWISFLGAAMVMKDDEHIRLDVIMEKLSAQAARRLKIFIQLLISAFSIITAWKGIYLITITMQQVTPVARIPMGIVYIVLPFSCLVMAFYSVCLILDLIHENNEGAQS